MVLSENQQAFLALLRAGLWEQDTLLSSYKSVDFKEFYRIAEEQSVVGLVTAGLEHVGSGIVPKEIALAFVGCALQLEQRNLAMNQFIARLVEALRNEDIYALLVKGQGIAQCYERPLWRASGDIDLLLAYDSLNKAKSYFEKITGTQQRLSFKDQQRGHYDYSIGDWTVELHGTMHTDLSRRVDKGIDMVQEDIFSGGGVRSWMNGNTIVYLPSPNYDAIIIFTHILQHLFLEGIGLRQICDWCRLLWTYKDSIDKELLKERLVSIGLISEWKVFAALAVYLLGMPEKAMPLFSKEVKWERKAHRVYSFILDVGNFGHNREMEWSSPFKRRLSLIWHRITDTVRLFFVFPIDAPKFLVNYAMGGVKGIIWRLSA